jgi:cyclopropane-fatty-acyl-phospholipid synthase
MSAMANTQEPTLNGEPSIGRRLAAFGDRRGLSLLLGLATRLQCGTLELVLPDGSTRQFHGPQPGPHARLRLNNGRLARRYLTGGSLGFAEAYIDGDWETPDLAALLALLNLNEEAWGDGYFGSLWHRWLRRVQHLLRPNTRSGSRRNIYAHYDLGNEFFAAWLDPTMTYSSALFAGGEEDLEAAQRAKYRHLAQEIAVGPGQKVLEIGSGWGGFAVTAAKEFGAKVTSITVSSAQAEYARARVFREGLNEQVEILLQDYRDVRGRYDRIASIEMFEAVGERFWPTYFATLRDRLLPDGAAGLQLITIADRYFESYRRNVDFIQAYIFPGGMLPSPAALDRQAARAGLRRTSQVGFGDCYARTLALWNQRFQTAWPAIGELGFDERFRRIWTYYLAYCEAGFRTRSIDVIQTVLRPA